MKRLVFLLTLITSLVCSVSAASKYDNADTLIVAQDGTGHFRTVGDAVHQLLPFRDYHKVVLIRKGIYHEKVELTSTLTNVELLGEDRDSTIITFDDNAQKKHPLTGRKLGTFGSYTLKVQGRGITLRNLTIANPTEKHTQAVALHTDGDLLTFVNCRFLGFVDTIYTGTIGSRLYFYQCYIEGTLDFVFGPATAWFEQCEMYSKSNEYATAASTPAYQPYGYVFNRCRLTAADGVNHVFLGRPWRSDAAYTVLMNCHLGAHIVKAGWHDWGRKGVAEHVRYMEYRNEGPGADTSGRVSWSRQLSDAEAKAITPEAVLGDMARSLPYTHYLFAYFTSNSTEGQQVCYAVSDNGLDFKPLNDGKPILACDSISLSGGVRDPHILRGDDGWFRMVLTDMDWQKGKWSNRGIVMLRSKDLIHWQHNTVHFPTRYAERDAAKADAVWAPQTIYDPEAGKYMVYFSLHSPKGGPFATDAVYYAYANDDFTDLEGDEPQRLFTFDGPSIDTDIVRDSQGRYHVFFNTWGGGGTGRRQFVAESLHHSENWQLLPGLMQPEGVKMKSEGSSAYPLNDNSAWVLAYDCFADGVFHFCTTTDLEHFTLVRETKTTGAFTPRHGSVIPLTEAEYQLLKTTLQTLRDHPCNRPMRHPSPL